MYSELINLFFKLFRCRRKLIASHFDETWESTDCNAMCDNCSNPKTLVSTCINKYCLDLYKLLNAALENDTKFTGMLLKKKKNIYKYAKLKIF